MLSARADPGMINASRLVNEDEKMNEQGYTSVYYLYNGYWCTVRPAERPGQAVRSTWGHELVVGAGNI